MPDPAPRPCSCGKDLGPTIREAQALHPRDDSWTIECPVCSVCWQAAWDGEQITLTLAPTGGLSGGFGDVFSHPSIVAGLLRIDRLERLRERRERDRKRRKKQAAERRKLKRKPPT